MSSFFTLPASQRKRKRTQPNKPVRKQSGRARDDSISGSDLSEDEALDRDEIPSESGDDALDPSEDPAAKRLRLAEQYIANTKREVLEDVGFDAAEIDAENLQRRMGERLKEDTAESRGKLYRWIAHDLRWDRAERAQFRHHQKSVTGLAISGDYAYTVGKDSVLVKWRLPQSSRQDESKRSQSRKPRKILVSRSFGKQGGTSDSHTGAILCVAASHDGRFVATGGADKKLIVWDASSLRPLRVFRHHRDAILSLDFRRGTNQLFSASKDRTIKIWSLDELAYVETLFGHQDDVVDVSALAQEKCISVGARDRTARLWKVVEESQLVFRGGGGLGKSRPTHHNSSNVGIDNANDTPYYEGSIDRVVYIDEDHFVTGSDNGSLSLWNTNKKKALFTYPLAHGIDAPLLLHDVSAELEPDETVLPKPQPRWITALAGIPFSDVFVSGSWDGFVRVWKITSDKRRIEPLGCVGCVKDTVESLLRHEELSADILSSSALAALQEGTERNGRAIGCVNDLAVVDHGEGANKGAIILAAIGKEPKLGRWKEIKGSKNCCILFEVTRKQDSEISVGESVEENLDDLHGIAAKLGGSD